MIISHYSETQIIKRQSLPLQYTLYHSEPSSKPCIIYIHGGGLIYGTRHDLPSSRIESLLDEGYSLLAIDYPLAPQSALDIIIESVYQSIQWYIHIADKLPIDQKDYLLWGRSSGAYLMFRATDLLLKHHEKLPKALINFYGYTHFEHHLFFEPRKLKGRIEITHAMVEPLINEKGPLVDDPAMKRVLLYEYARQNNAWLNLLGIKNIKAPLYNTSDETLSRFPKSFNTASSGDEDVPFFASKQIAKQIPHSLFVPVYNLPHDFDTNQNDPQVTQVYEKLSEWLNG
ncbi:alpha/beta hydrolase fold domain-containing protein [Fusibacter bizertensis]